ncbi:triphosphoribosyl-dephospho-CoA synthase [Thermogladius sp. KZ2Tp1]|uniref:triphosphoribosyl-dephospho-CoA synthase n=1 Tax=Thermogladius sp. KZ2Tp1 TaxID=3136289 RepID=UPI003DA8E953
MTRATRKLVERYSTLLAFSIALEVSAYPKPGNTHRLSDYRDKPYLAFLLNSIALKDVFERTIRDSIAKGVSLGRAVYRAARATVVYSGFNTSLGQILLLSPLAISIGRCVGRSTPSYECFVGNYKAVVEETTVEDSVWFYKAVRLVKPSYIRRGGVDSGFVDVWDPDFANKLRARGHRLVDVLQYASRIDVVSDEVVSGLKRSRELLDVLEKYVTAFRDWNKAVVATFIELLSTEVDTLVSRKHGYAVALEVKREAEKVKERLFDPSFEERVSELDRSLKSRMINPGSLADLLTSTIALFLLKNGVGPVFTYSV